MSRTKLHLNWRKLVPLYGPLWDKFQPHDSFMCEYDPDDLRNVSDASSRVFLGFAGMYVQMLFMSWVGTCLFPRLCTIIFGDQKTYLLFICAWNFVYMIMYAMYVSFSPSDHVDAICVHNHSTSPRSYIDGFSRTRIVITLSSSQKRIHIRFNLGSHLSIIRRRPHLIINSPPL